MNYLKHYCNLIRKAENRIPPEGYTEKHHTFPVSIFGKNNRIVVLTGREHYIAHSLLEKGFIKRYGKHDKKTKKMSYAFWCMNSQKSKNTYLNSYLYEGSRIRVSGDNNPAKRPENREKISRKKSGKNHHQYGKPHSQETRDKIGESNRGENNHISKYWKLTFSDGNQIVLCGLNTWAKKNGYTPQCIRTFYYEKRKKYKDIIGVEILIK
jgi:hypothetical protein